MAKHKTPLLDQIENGPWPSFVSDIKREASRRGTGERLMDRECRSIMDEVDRLGSVQHPQVAKDMVEKQTKRVVLLQEAFRWQRAAGCVLLWGIRNAAANADRDLLKVVTATAESHMAKSLSIYERASTI